MGRLGKRHSILTLKAAAKSLKLRQIQRFPATGAIVRRISRRNAGDGWEHQQGELLDGDAFRQIAGLIDITSSQDSHMVGEKLQGNGRDDRLQKIGHRGNDDHVVG